MCSAAPPGKQKHQNLSTSKLSGKQKRQNLVCDVFHLIHKFPQHNFQQELKIANVRRIAAPYLQLPATQLKSLEKNIFFVTNQ